MREFGEEELPELGLAVSVRPSAPELIETGEQL